MTQTTPVDPVAASSAFDAIEEQFVPLDQIGIAPENLRAAEGPDEEIPQLAETLFIAGQLHPLFVRPGRGKKEAAFVALDGRRRRFGWLHNVELGRVPADHPIRVKVLTDPSLQVAAAMLPNTEQAPPDLVDVITAVGRLLKRKHSPAEIAKSLGYKRDEVLGWSVLADLHDSVLQGLRQGRITLKQAKMLTKLSGQDQADLANQAAVYGRIYDDAIRVRLNGALVTVADRRVRLAGLDNYTAAGGRIESDLFGETSDILLDPSLLQQTYEAQLQPLVEFLKSEGLEVFSGMFQGPIPEGFKQLPYLYGREVPEEEQAALDLLEERELAAQSAVESLADITPDTRRLLVDFVAAALDYVRAAHDAPISAATLLPHARTGVQLTFHTVDVPALADDEASENHDDATAPSTEIPQAVRRHGDVDIPRVDFDNGVSTHALNERYTDVATRGLIRALADDPQSAMILLVARLFANVALTGSADPNNSISTLKADRYHRHGVDQIPELDGAVAERLDERRAAYLASGLRPVAWVATLPHGERMSFLAELVAMTLNGREFATHAARHGARSEALEIAELTGYEILDYWTPGTEFYAAHNKRQLLQMLEVMDGDVAPAVSLKKDDLANYVTETAAERRWAPRALSWRPPEPQEVAADAVDDEAPEGSRDPDGAPLEADPEVPSEGPTATPDVDLPEAA